MEEEKRRRIKRRRKGDGEEEKMMMTKMEMRMEKRRIRRCIEERNKVRYKRFQEVIVPEKGKSNNCVGIRRSRIMRQRKKENDIAKKDSDVELREKGMKEGRKTRRKSDGGRRLMEGEEG